MPSSPMNVDQPLSQPHPQTTGFLTPELLLSLAAGPFLVGLIAQKVLAETLQEVGLLSEEIFRGDRLPILNFPRHSDVNPE